MLGRGLLRFVALSADIGILGGCLGGAGGPAQERAAQQPRVKRMVMAVAAPGGESNRAYELQADIPLFWLPAEAVVNPKVVADYVWPGSLTGTWTHPEQIKAVK